MEPEIKITAHVDPKRPNTCKFVASVPLYENGFAFFSDKEKAKG